MMLRPTLDSELSGWDLDCHHTAPQLHLTRSSHGVISYTYLSLYHLLIKANVYTFMDFLQSPVSPSPWAQCRQITASLSGVRHLSSGYNSHGETENSVKISYHHLPINSSQEHRQHPGIQRRQ